MALIKQSKQSLKHPLKQSGFTLVELIMVIIILGIVGAGVTSFVNYSTRIYMDTTAVTQMLSDSRFAMERITREIRNAVPNSLRVKSADTFDCLEFMPIKTASSYIVLSTFPEPASHTAQVFPATAPLVKDDNILVYPLTPKEVYSPVNVSGGKLYRLAKNAEPIADSPLLTLTFDKNVQFAEASPSKRFFAVSTPVSYCFINTSSSVNLYRYADYGIHDKQPAPNSMNMPSANGVLMAENITNNLADGKPIQLLSPTMVNNAMVVLTPEFEAMGTQFKYQQQVQVINVP